LRKPSISPSNAIGSITTPFPITQTLPRRKIPEGIRCRMYLTPRWKTVCPALLPPWLRTTMSAFAVSTSIILPLPSSPHCAPTKIVLAIAIRNGQKIFPMHPAGHSRDCLRIIGWRHLRAREFALPTHLVPAHALRKTKEGRA